MEAMETMEKKFVFDDELVEFEELEEELNEQNSYLKDQDIYLLETNFDISLDNRIWESYVEDIDGGDNFADYCNYIFKMLEDEDYFED